MPELSHSKHKGIAYAEDGTDLVTTVPTEVVAGGAGFTDVSGSVALDLSAARVFHLRATGNITSLAFSNLPTATEFSTIARVIIRQDATGGHSVATIAALEFRDGHAWTDLDANANAENSLWLERVGSVWHAYLDNGTLALDDLMYYFLEAGTLKTVVRDPQVIDVANAEVNGAGTITYAKNGSGITVATSFAKGDVLSVTGATGQSVTIPRTLP